MFRNMSLREFAKYAGVSPQRVEELVKVGKIKRLESGLIPSSELDYFIREDILKKADAYHNNVICIAVCDTEEDFSKKVDAIKGKSDRLYVGSVDELVAMVQNESVSLTSFSDDDKGRREMDLFVRNFETAYKVEVLLEFKKRLLDAVYRHVSNMDGIAGVGSIPLGAVVEMLKYDQLFGDYGVSSDEVREVLLRTYGREDRSKDEGSRAKAYTPLRGMQFSFNSIIRALNMVDESHQPIIQRTDVTPEFLSAIDGLGIDNVSDRAALSWFMNSNMVLGCPSGSRKKEDGSDAEKIKQKILNKKCSAKRKSCIGSILSTGIVTCKNITDETGIEELSSIIKDISDGYYTRIIVLADEDYARTHLREALYTFLQARRFTRGIEVVFGYRDGLL